MAILVIEDEPGIADFVRRGLEAAGFTVEVEADGALGLLAAQGEHVQLVILDLGLPGLSGEEVLTRLRALRPALPVIVLTAKGAVADRVANLTPAPPVVLLGDEDRLTQALLNLVVNARTHTPAVTQVSVPGRTAGDQVVFRVRDDGPGIDPAILPRVFEPFVTTKTAGVARASGLGLAVVEAVTEAQGGKGQAREQTPRHHGRPGLPDRHRRPIHPSTPVPLEKCDWSDFWRPMNPRRAQNSPLVDFFR